ncbi:MAG TPA: pyridoxal phosphate-dependent aminotransferase [Armatimonadota bacterium]|nr:pyridoxal phosphate-dependent aminotransferase [Armatimonadota bacterium]
MAISERAKNVSPSPTLAITAKAAKMKAEGIDVISFGAGEPDFDTPANIKAAAIKSIEAGFTRYTATSGIDALKEAIVSKFAQDNGLEYEKSQIVVSNGAKHSLYNAVLALVNPGDEVIIPSPYWVSYPEQAKLAGASSVFVKTDESTGFVATADMIAEAITPKTKLLVLNSPSNPTGGIYSRKQLEEIAELAVNKQIYVLSDEIYEKIIYDGQKHVSIASLGPEIKKLTVTINGFSKSYSMTGWRLGYAAAEPEIAAAMTRIQDHSTSNPVSFAQKGGVEALTGPQDDVLKMIAEFDNRRKVIVERLNGIPGVSCAMPGGAFYVFPNVSKLFGMSYGGRAIDSSDTFAEFLLDEANVAVVPGSGFGAPDYIRLSYATSMSAITNGLDRMAEAINKLK